MFSSISFLSIWPKAKSLKMDYFHQPGAQNRDEITPSPAAPNSSTSINPPTPPQQDTAQVPYVRPREPLRTSSVRIRRLPSTPLVPQINVEGADDGTSRQGEEVGRRRSSSAPQRMHLSTAPLNDLARQRTEGSHMPSVKEETSPPHVSLPQPSNQRATTPGRMRKASTSARSALGLERVGSRMRSSLSPPFDEYEAGVVDLLDVVG